MSADQSPARLLTSLEPQLGGGFAAIAISTAAIGVYAYRSKASQLTLPITSGLWVCRLYLRHACQV